MEVKVYAGYYELYITDKEMPKPYVLVAEFDNVPDAEYYVEEVDDWMWLDRDLISQSSYIWEGDDYETHTFVLDELIATVCA